MERYVSIINKALHTQAFSGLIPPELVPRLKAFNENAGGAYGKNVGAEKVKFIKRLAAIQRTISDPQTDEQARKEQLALARSLIHNFRYPAPQPNQAPAPAAP